MSTFAELYSDYIDEVKIYTEKLDITELSFMRNFTRAMQLFQRETEYIERIVQINRDANDRLIAPFDLLRVVEVKDTCENTLIAQKYQQFSRNVERYPRGYLETPTDYSLRLERSTEEYSRGDCCINTSGNARMWSLYNRVFNIYPESDDDNFIILRYIPDIHAISSKSAQWNTGDPTTTWYPTNQYFDTRFREAGVAASLHPYEQAFMDYAVALFIKSQGSRNYKIFEDSFWTEVERAKVNKPDYFTEGVGDYFMAPWS